MLARLHRIGVNLHAVLAVFQIVILADHGVRQLALLAHRHEADGKLVRHRAAQDEAARLDAGDLVDLHAGIGLHQLVDRARGRPARLPSRVVMSRNMIPVLG